MTSDRLSLDQIIESAKTAAGLNRLPDDERSRIEREIESYASRLYNDLIVPLETVLAEPGITELLMSGSTG